eukprot:9502778-Pyramimonas_sp.AAC.1
MEATLRKFQEWISKPAAVGPLLRRLKQHLAPPDEVLDDVVDQKVTKYQALWSQASVSQNTASNMSSEIRQE